MDSNTPSSSSSFLGPQGEKGWEQMAAEMRRKSPGEIHTGPLAAAQDLGSFPENPSLLTVALVTTVTGIMITTGKILVGLTV